MNQHFKDRVALITGAGGGLGRSHALYLASLGCRLVINDKGASVLGEGTENKAADETVTLIREAGGLAVSNYSSVSEFEGAQEMVETALTHFGRLDIVINNAGILRDASFKKQTEEDWQKIIDVHLTGSRHVTKAAWDHMLQNNYGRIVMTTSASGLYGNYGQSNYAAAKMGLVGLMNALKEEGAKANVRINAIAPVAKSRMTESMLPPDLLSLLDPRFVSPFVAYLASESCAVNGHCYAVGAGRIARVAVVESKGVKLQTENNLETIAQQFASIDDLSEAHPFENMMSAMASGIIS